MFEIVPSGRRIDIREPTIEYSSPVRCESTAAESVGCWVLGVRGPAHPPRYRAAPSTQYLTPNTQHPTPDTQHLSRRFRTMQPGNSLAALAMRRSGRTRRQSSYDRTGGNRDYVHIAIGDT